MANVKSAKVTTESKEDQTVLVPQVQLVALDFIEFRAAPGEAFTVPTEDAEVYVSLGRAVPAMDYPQSSLILFEGELEEVVVP